MFLAKELELNNYINYLGGYLEQCRYVNPFMPAGVSYLFKLTDRSVIIGCIGSDI